ncbi:UNVERIFIED_ORG: dTDP-glucose pyrophosphorylase [Martelella mediterranea]
MLNIVIPMAGRGSRFAEAGYLTPKPFLEVHGKPMIQVVMENLAPVVPHRFILICQSSHIRQYRLEQSLSAIAGDIELIGIDHVTEGQASSVLLASPFLGNDDPVMTANSDQFIDTDIDSYLDHMERESLDGLIMTMKACDRKWSFVRSENGRVVETAEKRVISHDAAVGIFNFRRGGDLINGIEAMIADNHRVNGEFYVCPVYNYLIRAGSKVGHYSIGAERDGMYGLGIPGDLDFFLQHPVSEKVR